MSEGDTALILQRIDELAAMVRPLVERAQRTIPDHPMTPAEVGVVLRRHEKTVRNMILRGKLKGTREGHTILVRPVDLQRFLDGGRK